MNDVFIYFTSVLFTLVLPDASLESILSRGLNFVRFYGTEIHGRQQRKVELRIFEILWNDLCRGFDPLIDVTFVLQKKSVLLKSNDNESRGVFNIFKSPTDRKIDFQAQEVSQPGTSLPMQYSEWSGLFPEKKIEQKYLEKQWDATVKVLFEEENVRYKEEIVLKKDHAIYQFITLFSLLLKKLNFRWSKIIKIEIFFKNCCLFEKFFPDSKRPYSGDDDENDLSQEGWYQTYKKYLIKLYSIKFNYFASYILI